MSVQYDALVRQSDAIAYYPFGRRRWIDVIGGNHFTTIPAHIDVIHDDVGDYTRFINATVSRSRVLTATNNFSVEFWIRQHGQNQVWTWDNADGGSNGYIFQARFTDGRMYSVAQSVALLETTVRSLPLGTWQHVVFMRNTSWQYWINGIRYDTGANSNAPAAPGAGAIMNLFGNYTDFKRLALYTRVLSYAEMVEHYKQGNVHVGPMLVASPDSTTVPIVDYSPSLPVMP